MGLKKVGGNNCVDEAGEKVSTNCLDYKNFSYRPKASIVSTPESVKPPAPERTVKYGKKIIVNNAGIPNETEVIEKDGQKKPMSLNHFFKNGAKNDNTKVENEKTKKPPQKANIMNFFGKK